MVNRLREHSLRLAQLQPDQLLGRLGERFRLRAEVVRTLRRLYLDTFDWRLHRAGFVLSHVRPPGHGPVLELGQLDGGVPRSHACQRAPEFSQDLSESFGGQLAKLIDVRRLLPLVRVDSEEAEHAILDDEGKTVVHLVLEQSSARSPKSSIEAVALPAVVRVRAVRGYERQLEEVVSWLAQDLGLSENATTNLEAALFAVGRTARDYTSKPTVNLAPDEPAHEALRRILTVLVETIDRNTPGTIADLDSEFLHDLRVATRRTRAALSRVKKVLDPEPLAHFTDELRWLGAVTGPTRDLDVLALKRAEYFGLLGEHERVALEPLATRIATERVGAQKQLARALASQRFRSLLNGWRSFLDASADPAPAASKALLPIGRLAAQRLRKTFARTLEIGAAADRSSPDADVHALRIQCKKLRYLLEFFRSLYPADEIQALVKALKGLQNVLGDFNDYSVHREYLGELTPSLPAGIELALGALREQLRLAQERERERFEERFQRFAGDENRERAERLFGKRSRR